MSIAERYRPYYTYDDYCQWEGRWELIEGMSYAMSPLPVPNKLEPMSLTPQSFDFMFEENCSATVNFSQLWE